MPRLILLVITLPVLVALPLASILLATLAVLALLSLAQFLTRRQPMPVWTAKTLMVTFLAAALSALAAVASLYSPYPALLLPLIVIGQPAFVLAAWAALWPIDQTLKRRVMDRAAAVRRSRPDLTVIGIAGSVGKTTTKELIKHLIQDLNPIATPAHVNTEMGVAQWINGQLTTDSVHRTSDTSKLSTVHCPLIVEMGAYREGEVALLCRIAQPTIGVLTTLGSDHLALFGSEEAIRSANAELIEALPNDGHAFVAVNDKPSAAIAALSPCKTTTVGDDHADLHATAVKDTEDGLRLTIQGHALHLPLHGTHNATNLLLAIGVARELGIGWDRIRVLLPSFRSVSHTFHVRDERGVTVLDDTYNISFLSFQAALEWARHRTERPRILITHGLLEVGDAEDEYHRRLGEAANGCIEEAYVANPKAAKAFAEGFTGDVKSLAHHEVVAPGSLLLCVGRMPLSTVQRFLP
jgi:UDP-N-acetylmuramoyl-tripeptide--D-alanyl-D-alanine ligase